MNKSTKKTITWNAFAMMAGVAVYYFATGTVMVIPFVILMDCAVFPICYYLHEKLWEERG